MEELLSVNLFVAEYHFLNASAEQDQYLLNCTNAPDKIMFVLRKQVLYSG
jgi:hypothetical protein